MNVPTSAIIAADLVPWLGSIAVMAGLLMLGALFLESRRPKIEWLEDNEAPALNERMADLQRSRTERFVAPGVDWLVGRTQRIMAPSLVEDGDRLVERSGPHLWLNGQRLMVIKLLLAVAFAVLAVALVSSNDADYLLLWIVAAVITGWNLPRLHLERLAVRRARAIARQLPEMLDHVTVAVASGMALEVALERSAQTRRGELPDEITRTLQDIALGTDRATAYQRMAQRCDSPELTSVVATLVQGIETGSRLVPGLKAKSVELRRKRRSDAEERAQKLSVKLALPTALCILPALMLVVLGPTITQVLDGGFNV